MVRKKDRERRGKGMQNFKYERSFDEFAHRLAILSPKAYREFQQYFQGRTIRSYQHLRTKSPRFPVGILEQCFLLALAYLEKIGYKGPLALGCDDTKLQAALTPYHDSETNTWKILGSTGEPIVVENLDQLAQVVASGELVKAEKVSIRLWVLSIPLPKVPPFMLCALAIGSNLSTNDLFALHQKVIDGLLRHNIQVVSYGADGTDTERQVQDLFRASASSVKTVKFINPLNSEDISISIPFFRPKPHTSDISTSNREFPIALAQDSKHYRKTIRNFRKN
ncbi:hypothetical protein SISNIDRAFT_420725 [Sistotremastrum niveocremeum HHB9708]|uniref:Uncharacterized protein n=1 Tax=Sistotremastrum niveocremeum HHB9708 TaxID=1314777 RepID=A0A164MCV4_9AGAM|nr:hypothetical protein SISNIDRAFT_420725 [Sistotremastrum niveocremeum HHB9708]